MAERKEKTLQRVTLKEMYDIFASDIYKEYREQRGLVVKNYGGMDFITIDKNTEVDGLVYYASEPLLLGHIAAEKCLREGYRTIPWDNYHVYDINECLGLFYKWVHPLFWINPISMETMVSEGRIAKEEYDPTRVPEVIDYCKYIEGYRLLNFADNPPLCDDDAIANYGYRKGMHIWITLTCNFEALMEMILDGEDISLLNEKVIPYDAASLRKNLTYIAERRGGKCAAELLRTLQNEWSTMELWKPSFDKMSDDEIEYFKNILYNDYDKLLKEWEEKEEKSEGNDSGKKEKSHENKQMQSQYVNENVEVDAPKTPVEKAIRAVYERIKLKASDWAAVVGILEERRLLTNKKAYESDAKLINRICGEEVTNANSIGRSIFFTAVAGKYPDWYIREGARSRQTPKKLVKYKEIGEMVTDTLNES